MSDPIVRGDALKLFERRLGISEAELARRAYPERSPGAARQRLRALKSASVTVLNGRKLDGPTEARQLADACEIEHPRMLGQLVGYVLVHVETNSYGERIAGRFAAPAGAVIAWDSEEEAREAAAIARASGLYEPLGVIGLVEDEIRDRTLMRHEKGPWRWHNDDFSEPMLDEIETFLTIERYARGDEKLIDHIAYHFSYFVLTHVAAIFRVTPRGERKTRLGDLLIRTVQISMDDAVRDEVKTRVSEWAHPWHEEAERKALTQEVGEQGDPHPFEEVEDMRDARRGKQRASREW